MGTYEKAYIYFDTNSLECRHSGKSLYLSQFIVNPIYYEIEDLIRNMGLTGKVEICIPDIVCFELREHLLKHFKAEKSSMETKIGAFRKSFGDLAEVICEFKDCRTEEEYSDYADGIIQDFLDSPRVNAKIISCPKDEESVKQIIQQAIHSELLRPVEKSIQMPDSKMPWFLILSSHTPVSNSACLFQMIPIFRSYLTRDPQAI